VQPAVLNLADVLLSYMMCSIFSNSAHYRPFALLSKGDLQVICNCILANIDGTT